jgi:hypothetical protein
LIESNDLKLMGSSFDCIDLEVNLLEKNVDILGEEAEQLVVDKIVWD